MTWHGVGKASCQGTVGGHVTGVDVSILTQRYGTIFVFGRSCVGTYYHGLILS